MTTPGSAARWAGALAVIGWWVDTRLTCVGDPSATARFFLAVSRAWDFAVTSAGSCLAAWAIGRMIRLSGTPYQLLVMAVAVAGPAGLIVQGLAEHGCS